ncbi:MAG: peptidoglycan recognition family protein [Planctomycetota bacterium]
MRRSSITLTLALIAALAGCYTPQIPQMEKDWNEARGSTADLKAHGDEGGEVLLDDLAAAHGLEIKIDNVTGRRFLEDARNKVVIPPGERYVVINGVQWPLNGEVRWKNYRIVLPGDARVLFGEKLLRPQIPSVDAYAFLDEIDPKTYHLPKIVKQMTGTAAKPTQQAFRIDQNAPPLPTSWNQNANRKWRYIVIHHSATAEGGAASFGRSHQKKWQNGLGYHFVIGNGTETQDGFVEVGSRWTRQNQGIDGAHAGVDEFNKHGIGVCLVGDFDHRNPTPRQLASLRNLVNHLMQRYGIPKDGIRPHRSVKSGHTECPGKAFPFEQFIRSL